MGKIKLASCTMFCFQKLLNLCKLPKLGAPGSWARRQKETPMILAIIGVATHVRVEAAIVIAIIPVRLIAQLGVLGVEEGDLFAILVPHEGGFLASVLGKGLGCLEAGVSTLGIHASDGSCSQINGVSSHHNFHFLSFFVPLL
jgi:hypothetical protein